MASLALFSRATSSSTGGWVEISRPITSCVATTGGSSIGTRRNNISSSVAGGLLGALGRAGTPAESSRSKYHPSYIRGLKNRGAQARFFGHAAQGSQIPAGDLRDGDIYLHSGDPMLREVKHWKTHKKGRGVVHFQVDYVHITGDKKGGYVKYFEADSVWIVKLQKTSYYFSYIDRENQCVVLTTPDYDEHQIPLKFVPSKAVEEWLETSIKPDEKLTVHRDELGNIVRLQFPTTCLKWLKERRK
ncbi:unnamed protein product [Amoebophrya sp. A25]|nr:unnamed protein product [Amoebophrya sp. A25]|eukprot:GSA25T00012709001.1